jgi:hypothetical protein
MRYYCAHNLALAEDVGLELLILALNFRLGNVA